VGRSLDRLAQLNLIVEGSVTGPRFSVQFL